MLRIRTVNMPEDTSSWRIFGYVYAGLTIPMILIETLGAAMSAFCQTCRAALLCCRQFD